MCLVFVLPISNRLFFMLFMHGCVSILMVRIGCNCRGKKPLFLGVLTLYLTSFLVGGMLQVLLTYTQVGIWTQELLIGESPVMTGMRTFLILGVLSYWLIIISIKLYGYLKGKISNICDVTLYVNGKGEKVKGLYDTGNHLQDTITHKPVSIVEYSILCNILSREQREELQKMMEYGASGAATQDLHPRYILYHSVGKEQGLLLAVTLEKLCIYVDSDRKTVPHPVVALTRESLSPENHFQMIINPNIIDG